MTHALTPPQRARYSDHSLVVYLAPLFEGRRVAVVGPASGEVARRCRALGATTVISFGGNGEGIAVRPLSPGSIESFHGRLDCIIVPDASSVNLESVLNESRRALGQDGIVAVGSWPSTAPAPLESGDGKPGPDFYALQDALATRFANVQMLGRGPFLGYTFARLGAASTGVSLDTRLVAEETPAAEGFIAVASDRRVALDSVSLVQIPAEEVLGLRRAEAKAPSKVDALEAKVKEAENASAERWVRIQRLEHDLKTLDEDARKARDKAVKLVKDLEDERKLRQRIELESQMSQRGKELPKVDPEEIQKARDRVTQLESELQTARAEVAKTTAKLGDFQRELEEAQSNEAELRGQLDRNQKAQVAQVAKVAAGGEGAEVAKFERELHARAEEVIALRGQVSERDAAVRELVFTLEAAKKTDGAAKVQEGRERIAELSALNAGLAAEARGIVDQNELLRERITQLEVEIASRRAEANEAVANVAQLESKLEAASQMQARAELPREPAAPDRSSEIDALRSELEEARSREESLRDEVQQHVLELNAQRAAMEEHLRSVPAGGSPGGADFDSLRHDLDVARTSEAKHRDTEELLYARTLELEEQLRMARNTSHTDSHDSDALRAEIEQFRLRDAAMDLAARAAEERHRATEDLLADARRMHEEERARANELAHQLLSARNDLSRQYAMAASLEDRSGQTAQELEGARAGYTRRVRELEHEVEQLVQALEVVGTRSNDDDERVDVLSREIDSLKAERSGMTFRLRDAEAALAAKVSTTHSHVAHAQTVPPAGAELQESEGPISSEQLLSDLAETAARLATTEELLREAREQTDATRREVSDITRVVESLRSELASESTSSHRGGGEMDELRREAGERELLVRSLVAQLEDRDLRLRAMERRLIEEVERARRTESEIWEVELRARDQRVAILSREVERVRGNEAPVSSNGSDHAKEMVSLRESLTAREREVQGLRSSIEQVRAGLSSILVDGRGAVVAHDLVSLLRQIEEPSVG